MHFRWICTPYKAYRLYNRFSGKVNISRTIVFDEDASWDQNSNSETCHIPIESVIPTTEGTERIPTNSPIPFESLVFSLPTLRSSSSFSLEESSNETPHRKFKHLEAIYESCQFALFV